MTVKDSYTFINESAIPPAVLKSIVTLFKSWDMPHSDNAYLSQFAPDGTLLFGPVPAKGRDAIQARRESMVDPIKGPVVDLEHNLERVFSLLGNEKSASGGHDIIMNGTIWYLLKNGVKVDAHWASRAVFEDYEGELKITFYEVYLDSAELVGEITKMMAASS